MSARRILVPSIAFEQFWRTLRKNNNENAFPSSPPPSLGALGEMASIRTFLYPTSTDGSTPPRTLALSRKGPSILLVHPSPLSPEYPNERQHTIINALARDDPFPKPSEEGRVRIWLKEGVRGKADGEGGENVGLREALLEARIIAPYVSHPSASITEVDEIRLPRTEIVANQGVMSYSLVELLVPESVFCLACEGPGCGKFETLGEVRWKRCARCRLSYYVRPSSQPFVLSLTSYKYSAAQQSVPLHSLRIEKY